MAGAEVSGDERLREQITRVQWERACIAAKVWKPDCRCDHADNDGYCVVHNTIGNIEHYFPCPLFGDDSALVAMLDWLVSNPASLKVLDYRGEIQAVMSGASDWKAALVRAVLRMSPHGFGQE